MNSRRILAVLGMVIMLVLGAAVGAQAAWVSSNSGIAKAKSSSKPNTPAANVVTCSFSNSPARVTLTFTWAPSTTTWAHSYVTVDGTHVKTFNRSEAQSHSVSFSPSPSKTVTFTVAGSTSAGAWQGAAATASHTTTSNNGRCGSSSAVS